MKKNFTLLMLTGLMYQAQSQVAITNLATAYQQDFNVLASTGTASTLPAGWLFTETNVGTGTAANNTYVADNGATNAGNTYSYGATGAVDRAFGCLQSGSIVTTLGVAFTNNSGATITALSITYFGEQWRLGTTARAINDRLDFQYSTDATSLTTGTFTDADGGDFITPNPTAAVGALDGNLSANRTQITFTLNGLSIASGSTFYLRWNDLNATGADDGLSVDDFSITFNGGSLPTCTTPAAQPSSIGFGMVTTSSFNVSFAAAMPAPDKYIAVISNSSTLGGTPTNGTTYANDDIIGNGTVIYQGNSNSFTASGLAAGTTYYFYIFSVNSNCSGGPLYLSTGPATGNQATTAPPVCMAPTGQVSNIVFSTVTGSSIAGSYTAAVNADGYLICISTNSSLGFAPTNGIGYAVGATVGNGKVIKYGQGNTFISSGLTASTVYYFTFFSLNGFTCSGGPVYNPTSFSTFIGTTAGGSGIPPAYYSTIVGQSCAALKTELRNIISTGTTPHNYADLFSQYTVGDVKTREVFYAAPNNTAQAIYDIYSDNPTGIDPYNFTPTIGSGFFRGSCSGYNYSGEGDCYNREHSVPQNWFDASASSGSVGPESDYHHIFPTDGKVNGNRSNYIYGEVATGTASQNGSKVGANSFAGLSGTAFEPINEFKGDVARAFLYFVTRYENNMTSFTGGSEGTKAFDQNTYPSIKINYLRLMLKWHNQDPVSQKEIDRNNAAYAYQNNRNPFVDHPEYADMIWGSSCPGLAALPVDVVYFKGKLNGNTVQLEWEVKNEQNLLEYQVERSTNSSDYFKIGTVKAINAPSYFFTDDVSGYNGKRLFYRLKRVDSDGKFKYSDVFTLPVPQTIRFTLYPNPVVSDVLNIKFAKPTSSQTQIILSDLQGRVYQQSTIATATQTTVLYLQYMPTGIYLLKLMGDDATEVQKIQVVH